MMIKKVELEAVAVKQAQYPPEEMPEIAFAGRSNVGKSSLINLLLNRKKLAKISGSPGKTRTINFYRVNDVFRIVDLPGYGYAKVAKSVSENWGDMIEEYLKNRKHLRCVFQLVDLRHAPSVQDVQMYEWLKYYGLSGFVIGTKADKISRNELAKNTAVIRKALAMADDDKILPVSALKRSGQEKIWAEIDQIVFFDEKPLSNAPKTEEG